MAEQFLMAIDAGTGSVRAVLFRTDGTQLSCVQREWEHREDPRYPGSMDFDWVHTTKTETRSGHAPTLTRAATTR